MGCHAQGAARRCCRARRGSALGHNRPTGQSADGAAVRRAARGHRSAVVQSSVCRWSSGHGRSSRGSCWRAPLRFARRPSGVAGSWNAAGQQSNCRAAALGGSHAATSPARQSVCFVAPTGFGAATRFGAAAWVEPAAVFATSAVIGSAAFEHSAGHRRDWRSRRGESSSQSGDQRCAGRTERDGELPGCDGSRQA